MKTFSVTRDNAHLYQKKLSLFEAKFTYPLGKDRFKIMHGEDYFKFFDRLGKWRLDGIENETGIIATGLGVLRDLDGEQAWYLADLKVSPEYCNRGIPKQLIQNNFASYHDVCNRFFAIAMNNESGGNNIDKLLSRIDYVYFEAAGLIEFFTLSFDEFNALRDEIIQSLGSISFLSLEGIKDIFLESTNKRMPLLHIQHGNDVQKGFPLPKKGSTHMMCGVKKGKLSRSMHMNDICSMAEATVYCSNMPNINLNSILSSDI